MPSRRSSVLHLFDPLYKPVLQDVTNTSPTDSGKETLVKPNTASTCLSRTVPDTCSDRHCSSDISHVHAVDGIKKYPTVQLLQPPIRDKPPLSSTKKVKRLSSIFSITPPTPSLLSSITETTSTHNTSSPDHSTPMASAQMHMPRHKRYFQSRRSSAEQYEFLKAAVEDASFDLVKGDVPFPNDLISLPKEVSSEVSATTVNAKISPSRPTLTTTLSSQSSRSQQSDVIECMSSAPMDIPATSSSEARAFPADLKPKLFQTHKLDKAQCIKNATCSRSHESRTLPSTDRKAPGMAQNESSLARHGKPNIPRRRTAPSCLEHRVREEKLHVLISPSTGSRVAPSFMGAGAPRNQRVAPEIKPFISRPTKLKPCPVRKPLQTLYTPGDVGSGRNDAVVSKLPTIRGVTRRATLMNRASLRKDKNYESAL